MTKKMVGGGKSLNGKVESKGVFFWSLLAFTREYRESELHSWVKIVTKTTLAPMDDSVTQWN